MSRSMLFLAAAWLAVTPASALQSTTPPQAPQHPERPKTTAGAPIAAGSQSTGDAQTPASAGSQGQPEAEQAKPASTMPVVTSPGDDFVFDTGGGLILFYVQPAKAADFEAVMTRVRDAILQSPDKKRREQAVGWKLYKETVPGATPTAASTAPPAAPAAGPPAKTPTETGPVLYLWVIDPALAKTSYDPVALIKGTFPAEAQTMYDRLQVDVVKIERMPLALVREMGK